MTATTQGVNVTVTYGGPQGTAGDDAYVYIAWASDASGTDFTTTFNASLDYIAFKNSSTAIAAPAVGDFTGLWKNYKGATGAAGDMAWKGQWQTSTLYKVNELVYHAKTGYGQSVYICTVEHTSGASTEPEVGGSWDTDWDLYSEGGADGADGEGTGDFLADGSVAMTGPLVLTQQADPSDPGHGLTSIYAGTDGLVRHFPHDGAAALIGTPIDGWTPLGFTLTYASATTATATGDLTALFSAGMKFKLTQTTAKYFFLVAIVYSAPNTVFTFYGGTDYTLANAAITSPYSSVAHTPTGFPAGEDKWTVETTSTSDSDQATPTANTWYNTGGSLAIPIGLWNVSYSVLLGVYDSSETSQEIFATLSTANNSESTKRHTRGVRGMWQLAAADGLFSAQMTDVLITLAAATTYYLNIRTTKSGVDQISCEGATQTTVIKAVCAYL